MPTLLPIKNAFDPELKVSGTLDSFTLQSSFLTAVVSSESNWQIVSLVDRGTGNNILVKGNALQFRNDNGNIYRFGYEEGCGFNDYKPTVTALPGKVVENGPVRVRVEAGIQVRTSAWTNSYNISYTLVAGEPFLRVQVSGAASDYTAVITEFEFNKDIATYEHGTPYHWDYKSPFPYGKQDDFKVTLEATHDFIIPKASDGTVLGAIYQNSTPAWGVSENQRSVYGVLLRNSPSNCAGKGAEGHDASPHDVSFAIRVPTGLTGAATGKALKEARAFHTPLQAVYIANPSFNRLPSTFSLGTVTSPSTGIITVAKLGQYDGNSVFFRVYQPENVAAQVEIGLPSLFNNFNPQLATALEEPLQDPISFSGSQVSYKASNALTTFALKPK